MVNVDGLRRTRICTLPVGDDCTWVGPNNVGSSILSQYSDGDSAYVLVSSPIESPSIHAVDLRTGISTAIYAPGRPASVIEPSGAALDVWSEEGFRIPAYHWRAKRVPGQERAVLIHVPGGPGLQGVPVWEPYISYSHGYVEPCLRLNVD